MLGAGGYGPGVGGECSDMAAGGTSGAEPEG